MKWKQIMNEILRLDMKNLIELQKFVKLCIDNMIRHNETKFESEDKIKILEILGLTNFGKDIVFDHDFENDFNLKLNDEYIKLFNSIVKHWLNKDVIVAMTPYHIDFESDSSDITFNDIKSIHIFENDIIIHTDDYMRIYLSQCNFFVIQDNIITPLHILEINKKIKMIEVFAYIDWRFKGIVSECDREITLGEFKTAKLEKR
jgi:hypothetical protein